MNIGLFVPCYVDQLYPHVAMATVDVLRAVGVEPHFPDAQTCCGQPMANTGCFDDAAKLAEHFAQVFAPYDYVVGPSGSCVAMVRHHFRDVLGNRSDISHVAEKTMELCEFLTDVMRIDRWTGRFPHRVGLHQSCHGLRELRLGSCSERMERPFSKPRQLLEGIEDMELVDLVRSDECCGFGGTFAIFEEADSCLMGLDRLEDHRAAGAEIVTAVDMSCLMHLDGLARRRNIPLTMMHIAEILAQSRRSDGKLADGKLADEDVSDGRDSDSEVSV